MTWLKECGACVGADCSLVSLSLPDGRDTRIQNACHHVLEHKSVTGDSLMMYKRMYYTQTVLSHTQTLYKPLYQIYNDGISKDDIICHYM